MSIRLCSVEDCDKSVSAKGLCLKHYNAYARRRRLSNQPNPKLVAAAAERFWTYVQKTETCWFWLGGKDRNGYGWAYNGQKKIRAHRYSYELKNGPLEKGQPLCHACDNPACVNPEHLWICSLKENAVDMLEKGRHIGKLDAETVSWLRENPERLSQDELAIRAGVSRKTIYEVLARKTWQHLDTEETTDVSLRWYDVVMGAEAQKVFERLSPEKRGRLIVASLE